ncbi:MAG: hypothetical protein QOH05_2814, partial [Acetobacteraceae bacterium]|nr:hypothetical protein [Acetobacteraceae bacterium]
MGRRPEGHAETETSDQANVLIPPPVAWGIAFLAGLG